MWNEPVATVLTGVLVERVHVQRLLKVDRRLGWACALERVHKTSIKG